MTKRKIIGVGVVIALAGPVATWYGLDHAPQIVPAATSMFKHLLAARSTTSPSAQHNIDGAGSVYVQKKLTPEDVLDQAGVPSQHERLALSKDGAVIDTDSLWKDRLGTSLTVEAKNQLQEAQLLMIHRRNFLSEKYYNSEISWHLFNEAMTLNVLAYDDVARRVLSDEQYEKLNDYPKAQGAVVIREMFPPRDEGITAFGRVIADHPDIRSDADFARAIGQENLDAALSVEKQRARDLSDLTHRFQEGLFDRATFGEEMNKIQGTYIERLRQAVSPGAFLFLAPDGRY